jgi:hypothetical protein
MSEAAQAVADAAKVVADAQDKIASSSDEAGQHHDDAAKKIHGGAEEHLTPAQQLWHGFLETIKKGVGEGIGIEIGEKLAEPIVELGKKIIDFPFEAMEKWKELILESAKAEHEAAIGADRLGITVEKFTQLQFAAHETGAETGVLERALFNLGRVAEEGGPKWDALGIALRNDQGEVKDVGVLFSELAEKVHNGSVSSAQAQDALGKGARQLVPLLREGAAGIEELAEKADRLGITINGAQAKIGTEFSTSLGTAKEAFEGLGRTMRTRRCSKMSTTHASTL